MNEITTIVITGLTIGLFGSFHCVGMCGPLAMVIPVSNLQGKIAYRKVFGYNIGRAITYAILGAVFGFIGSGFSLFGWQQALTIVCGVLMLLFVFMRYTNFSNRLFVGKLNGTVQKTIAKYLAKNHSSSSIFIIGLLNGLLPCGLVYIALTAATATGNPLLGALWMMAFGVGTIPAMALVMSLQKLITVSFRKKINKTIPFVITFFALLLIVRGLNLGIPYLSPSIETKSEFIIKNCH